MNPNLPFVPPRRSIRCALASTVQQNAKHLPDSDNQAEHPVPVDSRANQGVLAPSDDSGASGRGGRLGGGRGGSRGSKSASGNASDANAQQLPPVTPTSFPLNPPVTELQTSVASTNCISSNMTTSGTKTLTGEMKASLSQVRVELQ